MKLTNHRGAPAISRAPLTAATVLLACLLPGAALAQEKLSLDLETTVRLATQHSRKIKMRGDEASAAAYRRKQAVGRLLPKLSLTARYSRVSHVEPGALSLPIPQPDGTPTTVRLGEAVDNQYSLRVWVDQPLFTGFALRDGYRATKHTEAIARERVRGERAEVRAAAQEAYFNLLKARQLREVTGLAVRALDEHLRQLRLLHAGGRATELDVSRAQSRAAAAQVSLVQSRGAVDGAHLALTTLLGVPSTTALALAEVVDDPTPASRPGAAPLVTEALASRPEIAIARGTAAVAATRVGVERAALWPQLSLRLGYNYERPNQRFFPQHDRFDGSWDVSVVLAWTAWDWGVTYHGMKAAQAEAAAAARNVDEARDAVRLDVERQRQGYTTAAEKITAARQAVSSAERAHEAATTLFAAGRALSLDLLDAANELTRARSDLVQALADARIAWALVQKAVGRD